MVPLQVNKHENRDVFIPVSIKRLAWSSISNDKILIIYNLEYCLHINNHSPFTFTHLSHCNSLNLSLVPSHFLRNYFACFE